ncbi:tail fiber domain-containing protein [Fulvivirgaceae bacterium PWU4]|uniref:Tail fiber domain-containing protein n=1 Tax=Chryseosolibacter histidini TaxID=2782349 RepID=A0AAP2DP91_9BACT|nr:tail fiber domain-containing protein [Chryseosolibacter histidini]MBT1699064.1 tail fiber domain-containing protein [Chryseosolibacter histidini]
MEIKFTDRVQLKNYFKKNQIPSEENFREFIEASINQGEDGLVKLPGDPLSIKGFGEKDGVKGLLNFYNDFSDTQPAWSFNLNDKGGDGNVQKGFSIASGGSNRFFIQDGTGKVGIGITSPLGKLHIINRSEDANGSALVLGYDGTSNLRLGYHDEYSWIQSHGGKSLAINPIGNNVGIGITNPSARLHVKDGEFRVQASHNDSTKADIVAIYLKDGTQGIGISGNRMAAVGSNTNQDLEFVARGQSGLLRFYVNNGAQGSATFQIETNIANIGTTYAFSPHASYNGSLGSPTKLWRNIYCHDIYRNYEYQASDGRLKENLTPIHDALDKIGRLTGYRYDLKETFVKGDDRKNNLGLVAQEVEQVLPESVRYEANDDRYFINYNSLIPVLVEGIKQLAAQVNELRAGKA